jgi:hypothetical protein
MIVTLPLLGERLSRNAFLDPSKTVHPSRARDRHQQ